MTASEKLRNYTLIHAVNMEKLKLSALRQVMTLYKRLRNNLAAEVVRIDPSEPTRSAYRTARTQKLLEESNRVINEAYTEIRKRTESELKDAAKVEAQYSISSINRAAGVELASVSISAETMGEIVKDTLIRGAASREWWKRQSAGLQNRFADTIRMHMVRGSTLGEIVTAVRGSKAANYTDGLMVSSTREAEALIRTSIQTVANRAAEESFKANSDVVSGYIWVSTLDDRTTEICAVRDGLEYDLEFEPIGHSIPWLEGPGAIHWNCRSRSMPRLKDYKGFPKNVQNRIRTAGVRSSQFGYVKRDLRYEQWLKEQDAKRPGFADKILGSDKARLWKNSGLSLRDMVNGDGLPMTAEQLSRRYKSEWNSVFMQD